MLSALFPTPMCSCSFSWNRTESLSKLRDQGWSALNSRFQSNWPKGGRKLFLSDAISPASVWRATASDSEPGHSFLSEPLPVFWLSHLRFYSHFSELNPTIALIHKLIGFLVLLQRSREPERCGERCLKRNWIPSHPVSHPASKAGFHLKHEHQ